MLGAALLIVAVATFRDSVAPVGVDKTIEKFFVTIAPAGMAATLIVIVAVVWFALKVMEPEAAV
jgi:hypothetical protein